MLRALSVHVGRSITRSVLQHTRATKATFPNKTISSEPKPLKMEHALGSFSVEEIPPNKEKLVESIRQGVIGDGTVFKGPFGVKRMLYADYVASGKSLSCIEDYIRKEVLPFYGNTHTLVSTTGHQTTFYREEARNIIHQAVNATEQDAVLFTGSGTTSAISKLVRVLDITQYAAHRNGPAVVFVSIFEHHSNLLEWRESGAEVVQIGENSDGYLDLDSLEIELARYASRPLKIGSFTAASNITGILTDTDGVTSLLHRHGALSFWDYATAAPYVKIDMNPATNPGLAYKDAVFLSPHKFIGGVGTPGILVAKKRLFTNEVPSEAGGGTVFFVSPERHQYLQDVKHREEGGTPAVVESIRAGMVMQLQRAVGHDVIMQYEKSFRDRAMSSWSANPKVVVLGSHTADRVAVFSLMFRHQSMYLHFNYVCALLNDLFGIQCRGGCLCAGPYAQTLLGISPELARTYQDVLAEDPRLDRHHLRRHHEGSGREVLRPGIVRLAFNYFMEPRAVDFIIGAVNAVADHGWRLLPFYTFDPDTAEWRHVDHGHTIAKNRKWLGHISYATGEMQYKEAVVDETQAPTSYEECLSIGLQTLLSAQPTAQLQNGADRTEALGKDGESLRWYINPEEAHQNRATTKSAPFEPKTYPTSDPAPTTYYPPSQRKHSLSNCFVTQTEKHHEITPEVGGHNETSKEETLKERVSEGLNGTGDGKNSNGNASSQKTIPHYSQSDDRDKANAPSTLVESVKEVTAAAVSANGVAIANGIGSDIPNKANDDTNGQSAPGVTQTGTNAVNEDAIKLMRAKGVPPPRKKTEGGIAVTAPSLPVHVEGGVRWVQPPRKLMKKVLNALLEYNMITHGDRVLVCVSGGKDSLSLLHILKHFQDHARIKRGIIFDLAAATVDPNTEAFNPSALQAYMAALGVPYFYESQCIIDQAMDADPSSICSFCARMKRGRLYTCARREGYNVLAFGQHLDDLAESFVMSVFHNGMIRTMKANYTVEEGDLRMIRPLAYVRERDLRAFAESSHLPIINENCPACFEAPTERHRMKQMLAAQEVTHPKVFDSILKALKPLMAVDKTGVEGHFAYWAQAPVSEKDDA